MKRLILLSIAIFLFSNAPAQNKIKLTKVNSTKVRFIREGMRVCYVLHGELRIIKGMLKKVDKTFIVVDDRTIAIEDLRGIGRKRAGSGFFQYACGFIGAGAIISSLSPAPTPSCNGCQTTTSSADSGDIVAGVALGAAIIFVGINSGLSNSPKDLYTTWKLEIVE